MVYRFTIVGAVLGFLIGLGEALCLYTTPEPAVFLRVDVQYMIWYIAPLGGAAVLGSIGLCIGLVAHLLQSRRPWTVAPLGAVCIGVCSVYAGAAWRLLHAGGQGLLGALDRPSTWISFLLGFGLGFLALAGRSRLDRELRMPGRSRAFATLTRLLVAGVAIAVAGLIFAHLTRSVAWVSASHAAQRSLSERPNIVLISLDTVRADHLSGYGYPRQTSPNLDRLARQGVLFENAIAPTSWTLASHATIFTGLLPHQHDANQSAPLAPGPKTLAAILKSRGYETAGFSANISYGFAGWGMDYGFDLYDDDSSSLRHNLAKTIAGRHLVSRAYCRLIHYDDFDRRNAAELNRDVTRWFNQRSGSPYFLFVNYYDAHQSYLPPPPFDHRFGKPRKDIVREMFLSEDGRLRRPLTKEEQESHVATYDNSLAYLDAQLGDLMRLLSSSPDWANTIVIITSDHGEAFGEHGRYGHSWDLCREVLHVPLVILGRDIPSGVRIDRLVGIRSLFATVLDLAKDTKEATLASSLRRFWTAGNPLDSPPGAVISELVSSTLDYQPAFTSLTTSEWHLIHNSTGKMELYHWPTDPLKKNNLANSPRGQAQAESLDRDLQMYIANSYPPWRGPEYLSGLDQPGRPFAHQSLFATELRTGLPPGFLRPGSTQSQYSRGSEARPRQLRPVDEEILRSLPYQ